MWCEASTPHVQVIGNYVEDDVTLFMYEEPDLAGAAQGSVISLEDGVRSEGLESGRSAAW